MSKKPNKLRHFASDNQAGICPEALAALEEVNVGHTPSYGDDPWTAKAKKLICDVFETDCEVFFVFNGTAANSLTIASMCESFNSVISHDFAHVETDECNAPGFFAHGVKLATVSGKDGKLTAAVIDRAATDFRVVHTSKPRAISLTQATELGTVYSPDELKAISKVAKKHGLFIHMDGARFANAVASQRVAPRKLTWEVGIDALCFGGTKNGMAFGEAVVFFNRDLAREFDYRRKQGGQLASKMRFAAAQWIAVLQDGAWLRHASHANEMAGLMEKLLRPIPSVRIAYPRQANAVFAVMPQKVYDGLHRRGWHFYCDVGPDNAARLMCSWDTTEDDVGEFVRDVAELVKM